MGFSTILAKAAVFPVSERQHSFAERFDKQKESAKTNLPKSIPTVTDALILFYKVGHVNESMAEERLHAKLDWKTWSRAGVTVEPVTRAWSVLPKAAGMGTFRLHTPRTFCTVGGVLCCRC